MSPAPPQGRRRFDLPPDAEKYLTWYGFLKRLPTTIFRLSLSYMLAFVMLTVGLELTGGVRAGLWKALYYLGGVVFLVSLFLFFAGWISRRSE
ncbi:hypothetical protein [Nitrospira defluvii]|uniref:Uncharacterized protein n=1 Tax=Nitrospira defluvii TaxID=330214 RepID=A0ABM8R9V0_9BACT|nr:hypothetical protein [Nitrospira defluvii]CAE6740607.1 hypothetical protein NSPZN2_130072 [Nitrospira defluvii]